MSQEEIKKPFSAFVKRVITGDRIELSKDDKLKTYRIAGIMVPHFKQGEKQQEEQFAFEAREHVRKLVLNNQVKVTEKGKGMASIKIGKVDIAESLLKAGYAALYSNAQRKDEEGKRYLEAQEHARAAKLGIWGSAQALKETQLDANKLKVSDKIHAVVEDILAPTRIRLIDEKRQSIVVSLAGCYVPLKRDDKKFVYDDDAEEAIDFLEDVVLQKSVVAEVVSKEGKKVSVVISVGKKNVNLEMVKLGHALASKDIAEIFDDDEKVNYLAGERYAKKNKSGRWHDYDEAAEIAKKQEQEEKAALRKQREKEAKEIKGEFIATYGTRIVLKIDGEKKTFHLASLREVKDSTHQLKEFLRKKLIGKYVMKLVYEKKFTAKSGDEIVEQYVDLVVDKKNIGNELIRNGLAKPIFTKVDEEKSFAYDQFVATYDEIKDTKFEFQQVRDLTEKPQEVKKMKDSLKLTELVAVIESIYTPNKYSVYLPSKNVLINVTLAHTKMPVKDIKDDAIKAEGREAVRVLAANQELALEVEEVMDNGMVTAIIKNYRGIELNTYVLEEGYALSAGKNELYRKTSEEAKEAKKGLWSVDRPEPEKKEKKVVEKKKKVVIDSRKLGEAKTVYMTGFDGREVYYYETAEEAKVIETIQAELLKVEKKAADIAVDKKVIVEVNKKLYRGVVVAAVPQKNVVKCIDTGLVVVVGKNKIRAISDELANKEATVKSIKMVGMKYPTMTDIDFVSAINFVNKFAYKTITIKEVINEPGNALIEQGEVVIAAEVLKMGFGYTYNGFKDNSEWGKLMVQNAAEAKENHINIWRYGELSDEADK